jgi:hypothetical protein
MEESVETLSRRDRLVLERCKAELELVNAQLKIMEVMAKSITNKDSAKAAAAMHKSFVEQANNLSVEIDDLINSDGGKK